MSGVYTIESVTKELTEEENGCTTGDCHMMVSSNDFQTDQ